MTDKTNAFPAPDDDAHATPSPLRDTLGLVTEHQLADALNIDVLTIRGWRREGTSPDFVKLGRTVFYRIDDVRGWITSRMTVQARRAG